MGGKISKFGGKIGNFQSKIRIFESEGEVILQVLKVFKTTFIESTLKNSIQVKKWAPRAKNCSLFIRK